MINKLSEQAGKMKQSKPQKVVLDGKAMSEAVENFEETRNNESEMFHKDIPDCDKETMRVDGIMSERI